MRFYIVQRGDKLTSVAEKQVGDVRAWETIARLNDIHPPFTIHIGQKLSLPERAGSATPAAPANDIPLLPSAEWALGQGYYFLIAEQLPEVGTQNVIRKVMVAPKDFARSTPLSPQELAELFPEKYGMFPKNAKGTVSMAEHAMGNTANSPWISASNRPFGAATMNVNSRPVLINLEKAAGAGASIHYPAEVIRELEAYALQHPTSAQQIKKLIQAVQIEGESLLRAESIPKGAIKPVSAAHMPYIRKAEAIWAQNKGNPAAVEAELAALGKSFGRAQTLGRGLRVVSVIGVVLTVRDMGRAAEQSIDQHSYRPVAVETVRQVGGWGGAALGAKAGFALGAALGIETGPGAIITGAVGAMVFGGIGYFAGDKLAQYLP
jgi:LysM domain